MDESSAGTFSPSTTASSSPSTSTHDIGMECEAEYVIVARIGEMYAEGLYGLMKNLHNASTMLNEAADKAIQSGKGRLAHKYYEKAEKLLADYDELVFFF
jgi:hypothetical protein